MATDIMKELHRLIRKAGKLYDEQVEFVLDDGEKLNGDEANENVADEDDKYMHVYFFVTPKDGPYRNARIKFHMRVDASQYPNVAPEINCRNSIYHPNINVLDDYTNEADICVNLLDSDWEPEVGLDGAVMAILFLFHNPQLDDALSPVCNGNESEVEFEENVRRSLRGEDIDGYCFDKLINESAETEDKKDVDTNANTDTSTKNAGQKVEGGAGAIPETILIDVNIADVMAEDFSSATVAENKLIRRQTAAENELLGDLRDDTATIQAVESVDVLQSKSTETKDLAHDFVTAATISSTSEEATTSTVEIEATITEVPTCAIKISLAVTDTTAASMANITESTTAVAIMATAATTTTVTTTTTTSTITTTTNTNAAQITTENATIDDSVNDTKSLLNEGFDSHHQSFPCDQSHQDTIKCSIFKSMYFKIKSLISPRLASLKRKS